MLQIDPLQFLAQVAGLFVWVCLAAFVYSIAEKALGGPAAPDEPPRM